MGIRKINKYKYMVYKGIKAKKLCPTRVGTSGHSGHRINLLCLMLHYFNWLLIKTLYIFNVILSQLYYVPCPSPIDICHARL